MFIFKIIMALRFPSLKVKNIKERNSNNLIWKGFGSILQKKQFDRELYKTINDRLLEQALTLELIKILALRLQRSATYVSDESVQAMKFSCRWWENYKEH